MVVRRRNANDELGHENDQGFALMETLVGIVLFAIVGLAFANSIIVGYKLRQRMLHRSTALQVASDEWSVRHVCGRVI
ncbi:MAG: prepilin-type N-terminal cleavage/methylation domain-containing protein [Oligoflexia bacterium]|nr:prepilin-type N-terminal cleavage/methylation domain-containing protein [Oligoflexia bacterium]